MANALMTDTNKINSLLKDPKTFTGVTETSFTQDELKSIGIGKKVKLNLNGVKEVTRKTDGMRFLFGEVKGRSPKREVLITKDLSALIFKGEVVERTADNKTELRMYQTA